MAEHCERTVSNDPRLPMSRKNKRPADDMADIDEANDASFPQAVGYSPITPAIGVSSIKETGKDKETGSKETGKKAASSTPVETNGAIVNSVASKKAHAEPAKTLDDVNKEGSPLSGLDAYKIVVADDSPARPTATVKALEFFDKHKDEFNGLGYDIIYKVPVDSGKNITQNVLHKILIDDACAREVDDDVARENEDEEEEEEEEEEWEQRDQSYDFEREDGVIKNYAMMPNVGSLESLMTNETETLTKLKAEYDAPTYMSTIATMKQELDKKECIKSEKVGFNAAVEMIAKLQDGDTFYRNTFVRAFMPGFKHFAVLPHAIEQSELKIHKITAAKLIVADRVEEKKKKKMSAKVKMKAKRDLANALGSSSKVEPSRVAKKSRAGSASDSVLRLLMHK